MRFLFFLLVVLSALLWIETGEAQTACQACQQMSGGSNFGCTNLTGRLRSRCAPGSAGHACRLEADRVGGNCAVNCNLCAEDERRRRQGQGPLRNPCGPRGCQ